MVKIDQNQFLFFQCTAHKIVQNSVFCPIPIRGEDIDRRYIVKAIIEVSSQYRKVSILSPQYRHINVIF